MEDSLKNLVSERRKKLFAFLIKKKEIISYFLLALVVYIAVWIRTRNLHGLRDVTTGGWTLGPDLDPFLFLRYAKYIVENGSLFALDTMRYVPLGFQTGMEYPFLHNSIAWFHNLASMFGSTSVEQSAVIYPVFMFALTVIAFFFMTREAFTNITTKANSNYIAVVASFFLSVIPSLIPRTIAGIPEKESVAFFFLFAAFYFFLVSWRISGKKGYILAGVGGIFAGLMALTWGGFLYLAIIVSLTVLTMFFFNQVDLKKTINYTIFIFICYVIQFILFQRITFSSLLNSFENIFVIFSLTVVWTHIFLHRYGSKIIIKKLRDYPHFTSLIYGSLFLGIIGTILVSPKFILTHLNSIYIQITNPANSRLIQTVAENRQPFFVEWAGNFGPMLASIPSILIISFVASVILIYSVLKSTPLASADRWKIVGSWIVFLFAVTYTKYNESSIFNGTNLISKLIYFVGLLAPLAFFVYVFFKSKKQGERNPYVNIKIGNTFILLFLVLGLISARAYIRLVLVLVPIVSILLGYIFVRGVNETYHSIKSKNYLNFKTGLYILVIILILFAANSHFVNTKNVSQNYVPSSYTQQWQKAMSWVRENVPTNAVFGHWWDYGYWVQSMGERATVLDGGNLIGYWNHLMGRYGLTETDFEKTLEFLYSHDVTHFLIDSTDIGKYSAYSTIGSDSNYDRRSWIPTFLKDNSQTTERKNTTLYVYSGGTAIDQDIKYNQNGTEIFLPEGKTYIIATVVAIDDKNSVTEVYGVYYFQNRTYQIPIRYYWDSNVGLIDSGEGILAGVFLYPRAVLNSQGGGDIDLRGASLYLSPKTVLSNVARFYLYGEENNNFKLVHSENDQLVDLLLQQNAIDTEFVFFNEFRGPIKIWEVSYPPNIELNEDFLKTEYPAEIKYS